MTPRLQDHIIFGPLRSRQLGRSLGVNLLPAGLTVCNLNCAYCLYGAAEGHHHRGERKSAWPSPAAVQAAVATRLRRAADSNELLDRLTVAGHGEPTLHPEFEEIVGRLRSVRDHLAPDIRLAILSNSTTAAWRDVRRGLMAFDERYMKLDAGDAITFARLNGPGASIAETVDALATLGPLVLQATFVRDPKGQLDNSSEGAIHEWINAVRKIRPSRVHLCTIGKGAGGDDLAPVPVRRLREIAEHVRAAGIQADVATGR